MMHQAKCYIMCMSPSSLGILYTIIGLICIRTDRANEEMKNREGIYIGRTLYPEPCSNPGREKRRGERIL